MMKLYRVEVRDRNNFTDFTKVEYEYGEDSLDALTTYLDKHQGLDVVGLKMTDTADLLDAAKGTQ